MGIATVLMAPTIVDAIRRGGIVKIDGLREPAHAAAAAVAGADLIGFVFAPARRQVTPETARGCIQAARAAAGRRIFAVGVFVDAQQEEILATSKLAGLDVVQLHGSESPEAVRRLGIPVIKALRPKPGAHHEDVVSEIDRFQQSDAPPIAVLIDGFSAHAAGGAGIRANWSIAASVAATRPILLGGGLDAENVALAIRWVSPLGVDVSSGVEVNGVKDPARIEAFILAARNAFDELAPRRRQLPAP